MGALVAIEPVRSDQLGAVRQLRAAVGWQADSRSVQELADLVGPGLFLLWEGDRAVGMVSAIAHKTLGYIGNVAVLPAYRHRGYGTSLTQWAMGFLLDRGVKTIALEATALGEPVYRGLGFREGPQTDSYLVGGRIHLHGSEAVFAANPRQLDAIVAYDKSHYPGDREALLRFWMARRRAFIYWDRPMQLRGYIFVGEGAIGPWMADDPRIAEALLAAALSTTHFWSSLHLSIFADNQAACHLLESCGASITMRTRHMEYGAMVRWPKQLFGLGDLALG